jgi:hypothetical protein
MCTVCYFNNFKCIKIPYNIKNGSSIQDEIMKIISVHCCYLREARLIAVVGEFSQFQRDGYEKITSVSYSFHERIKSV